MDTKVLVIDDESVTRRVVKFALKSLDIEVIEAADGTEGVTAAEHTDFSMAIVDINLPDIDGFEVIRRLKAMKHLQDTPMVIFTARNHSGDEMSAKEVGAVGFLYKPFSTQELRDLVNRHLD